MSKLNDEFEMQCRAAKIGLLIREHKFHPIRRWRLDFYFPGVKLGVELQGGSHNHGQTVMKFNKKLGRKVPTIVKSGHLTPKGFNNDSEKHAEAICLGITVLWFPSDFVRNGKALQYVERVYKRLSESKGL